MTRFLISVFALALSTSAGASQIFVPSGRFVFLDPEHTVCRTEPPRPGRELPCVAPPPSNDAASAIGRAEGFVVHGRSDLAAAEIKAALERSPNDAALWHFSGRLQIVAGNLAAARAELRKSLELNPEDGDSIATAAYLISMAGELRSALKEYDRALARSPSNQLALVEPIFLHEQLGDIAEAEAALARLRTRWPDHSVVIERDIDRDMQLGNFRGALERADAAERRKEPSLPDLIRHIQILQAVDEHARAVAKLDDMIGHNGSTPRFLLESSLTAKLRFTRALSHKALRQFDEARRDVMGAIRGANASFLLRLSVFLVSQGFDELAVTNVVSKDLEDSAVACILNMACGHNLARKI